MLLLDAKDDGQLWPNETLCADAPHRWGVKSEFGRLTDVLLSAPEHLAPVPCCAATIKGLRSGYAYSTPDATAQHAKLVSALRQLGVRCHFVASTPGLPDLTFTRDSSLMTPWGLVELSPSARHRRAESIAVREVATAMRLPLFDRIASGRVEGGDVCLLRPGVVIIGCSGERTCETGAQELASMFEAQGWRAIIHRFDPHFLHLDTQFCVLDERRALACVDVLDDAFLEQLAELGVELIPVSYKEAQRLGCNILSIGEGRLIAAAESEAVNARLRRLGYDVTAVEIDQLTHCGGGVHCLTMPLARR